MHAKIALAKPAGKGTRRRSGPARHGAELGFYRLLVPEITDDERFKL
jgi:hypothetical protein